MASPGGKSGSEGCIMGTLVYRYGLLAPVDHNKEVREQMWSMPLKLRHTAENQPS